MLPRITKVEKIVSAYTSKGPIQATTCLYNRGRDKYYRFDCVPYAHIPIGNLRFADPKDIQTFEDLKFRGDDRYIEENCLFLCIYTPEVRHCTADDVHYTRPVIVFVPSTKLPPYKQIFGGEFLMSEDVVLVVLNYRHDILGFTGFSAPDEQLGISGTAGVHDIIKGFEFVKKEIRNFGGCPDNITAYGHGVACKYFHKMILGSSTGHSIELPKLVPQYDLRQVAEAIGPDEKFDDDKACVEFLRKVPIYELLECSKPMLSEKNEIIVRKNNLLAVQGDIYTAKIPVLIGFTSLEGSFKPPLSPSGQISEPLEYLGRLLWLTQTNSTEQRAAMHAAKIIEVYQNNLKAIGCRDDNMYLDMINTDIKYLVGIIHLVTNLAQEMHPENVYLYQFAADFSEKCRFNQDDNKYYPGAGHGEELGFIFSLPWEKQLMAKPERQAVIKRMTGIWARFARTGNPNPGGPVDQWHPVGEQLTHYYEIRPDCAIYREFTPLETIRFKLWETIYGIDFFSAPIKKRERDAEVETAEKTDVSDSVSRTSLDESGRSAVQTDTILPEAEPHDAVFAYTSKGSIEGDVCFSNNVYYSFQHVPYAQVPVGNLRFAAPKDISSFGDMKSLKLDENGRYGLEDQLFLHIYTREVRPEMSNKDYIRPVIVFVPGRLSIKAEEFRSEDLYGPQFLLEEDVVLVVLSYRCGILGFTAFEEPNVELDVPIDAGTQDIMQGFRFVKNEIRNFGGCPDNVTAYGQGTGATHVRRIAARYSIDNLFHKMILSSSMEHATGINLPMPRYNVRYLANTILGHEDSTEDEARIELLRRMPIDSLLTLDAPLFSLPRNYRLFRKDYLLALLRESYGTTMPVLIGYNSMEGLVEQMIESYFKHEYQYDDHQSYWSNYFTDQPGDQPSDDYLFSGECAGQIQKFYSRKIPGKTKEVKRMRAMMYSDGCYCIGTMALASHFAETMKPDNVYLYRFGIDLDFNFTKKLYGGETLHGAAHADELGYIFNTPITKFAKEDPFEDLNVKRMTKLWGQFARTGNPNPEKGSPLFCVKWRPVGRKLRDCLHIGNGVVTYENISKLEMSRFEFWDSRTQLSLISGPKNTNYREKRK